MALFVMGWLLGHAGFGGLITIGGLDIDTGYGVVVERFCFGNE